MFSVLAVVGTLGVLFALRQLRGTPVLLLEDSSVVALFRGAICCVSPILRDFVDKEERKDLDALRTQALLLVEMLADRAADHLALNGECVHVAPGLSKLQVLLATWNTL